MNANEENHSIREFFTPFTTRKAISFIIIIGLFIFYNGLFNGFIRDDKLQITANPVIQSLNNLPIFFTSSTFYNGDTQYLQGAYYRPLMTTLFSFTYTFFGLSPFGFHLLQIILHIANACLVLLLFRKYFRVPLAFCLALIFLVHPINSEVALYISDTQEVLFFFFGMIGLLLLHEFHPEKKVIVSNSSESTGLWLLQTLLSHKVLIGAGAFMLLSLLSKETGILFVLIACIYIFIKQRNYFYPWLSYSFLVVVVYMLLRTTAVGMVVHKLKAPMTELTLTERLVHIPEIFLFYLKTFFFPLHLATSRHWQIKEIGFYNFFIPLLIVILTLGIFIHSLFLVKKKASGKYFSLYMFFSIWFFAGIILHLQIVPLDMTVAERWFYFPIVGLLGIVGVLFEVFRVNLKNKWIIAIIIVITISLAVRTFIRSYDFRNEFTISTSDIKVSKESYDSENNLSYVYFKEGKFDDAVHHAQRSVEIYPNVSNYTNLGGLYIRLGRYKEAKELLLKATKFGDYHLTYYNLATLTLFYGNAKENIDFLKNTALPKYPQDGMIWAILAVLEYEHGNKADAAIAIKQAYQYNRSPLIIYFYERITNNNKLDIQRHNGQIITK